MNNPRKVELQEYDWDTLNACSMNSCNTLELAEDLYFNHHSTPKEFLADKLPEANYCFVTNEDSELIGITSYNAKGKYLVITERTILFPKYRGQGYGALISQKLEDILREKGFKKIICEILTFNTEMLIIKIKQGFLIEGLMRNHDDKGIHQYFLGKELT